MNLKKKKCFSEIYLIIFSSFLLIKFILIDFYFLVRIKMDPSGSQQNSTGGNVILLNNNELMQQRTSLGNGQQVCKIDKKKEPESFHFLK